MNKIRNASSIAGCSDYFQGQKSCRFVSILCLLLSSGRRFDGLPAAAAGPVGSHVLDHVGLLTEAAAADLLKRKYTGSYFLSKRKQIRSFFVPGTRLASLQCGSSGAA